MFKSFSYGVYVAILKPLFTEFNSPFWSFLLWSVGQYFEAFMLPIVSRHLESFIYLV